MGGIVDSIFEFILRSGKFVDFTGPDVRTLQMPEDITSQQLAALEDRVQKYLALEPLFNAFFSSLDYCVKNCISKEYAIFPGNEGNNPRTPGYIACCDTRNMSMPNIDPNNWMTRDLAYEDASYLLAIKRQKAHGGCS